MLFIIHYISYMYVRIYMYQWTRVSKDQVTSSCHTVCLTSPATATLRVLAVKLETAARQPALRLTVHKPCLDCGRDQCPHSILFLNPTPYTLLYDM